MKSYLKMFFIGLVGYLLAVQLPEMFLPFYWGNEGLVSKMRHIERQSPPANTFFIGASSVYRQINPAVFDSLTGLKSFNLGYAGIFNPELYPLAEKIIENLPDGTKNVFVETQSLQPLANLNTETVRAQYNQTTATYWQAIEHILKNSRHDTGVKFTSVRNFATAWLRDLFKIDLWRVGAKAVFTGKLPDDPLCLGKNLDGFFSLTENLDSPAASESDKKGLAERQSELLKNPTLLTERAADASKKNLQNLHADDAFFHKIWVKRLLDTAAKRGIRLVFILQPRQKNWQYAEILPALQALPPEQWIDLSDSDRYPDFYKMEFAFDIGHLNLEGSRLYTHALANEFLKSTAK